MAIVPENAAAGKRDAVTTGRTQGLGRRRAGNAVFRYPDAELPYN